MSLSVDIRARRNGFVLETAFTADPGETVAILGPNGAGKSTLVAVIAGLLRPEAGRVVFEGMGPAGGLPPIGVVFQGLLLLPHLSVLENVAFPLRARGVAAQEARRRARDELARVEAAHLERSKPGPLSGGEAQRVALARALVIEPHVLLLDEPLSALDVSAKTRIRALLRSLLRGFDGVALVVTHDPIDAMTLGDRIVIIESGRVTHDATHEQVRVAPRTSYAADLVGVNLFAGRLEVTAEGAMIRTPTGDVACGTPDGVDEWVEGAMGILRPADVSLFLERPAGSARNVLPGPVTSVSVEGERARIGVGSSPPVVAEITLGSLRELGIAEGVTVWASFKALEVRVVLP